MCDINSRAHLVRQSVLVVDATGSQHLTWFPILPVHQGSLYLIINIPYQNLTHMLFPYSKYGFPLVSHVESKSGCKTALSASEPCNYHRASTDINSCAPPDLRS